MCSFREEKQVKFFIFSVWPIILIWKDNVLIDANVSNMDLAEKKQEVIILQCFTNIFNPVAQLHNFFIECYTEGIFDLLMLQVSSSAKFKIKFSRCFKNMLTKKKKKKDRTLPQLNACYGHR